MCHGLLPPELAPYLVRFALAVFVTSATPGRAHRFTRNQLIHRDVYKYRLTRENEDFLAL
jgi:hypothetical protein